MHATLKASGPPPVREILLYRMPAGHLVLNIRTFQKFHAVSQHQYLSGQGDPEIVHLIVEFWYDSTDQPDLLTITPETPEEIALFANAEFLRDQCKHAVHFYVVPKIPTGLLPEVLEIQ